MQNLGMIGLVLLPIMIYQTIARPSREGAILSELRQVEMNVTPSVKISEKIF